MAQPCFGILFGLAIPYLEIQNGISIGIGINSTYLLPSLHSISFFHRNIRQIAINGKISSMSQQNRSISSWNRDDLCHFSIENRFGIRPSIRRYIDSVIIDFNFQNWMLANSEFTYDLSSIDRPWQLSAIANKIG